MGKIAKLKTRAKLMLAALPMIGLAACLPQSEHPISDPSTAQVDQRLTGMWYGGPPDEVGDHYFAAFLPQDESSTDVFTLDYDEDSGDWMRFSMTPSIVGEHTYMNLVFRDQNDEDDDEFSEQYIICHYFIDEQGRLQIWTFGTEEMAEAIRSGLPGTVEEGQWTTDITITATSEQLQDFLSSNDPEDFFTQVVGIFERIEPATVPNGQE